MGFMKKCLPFLLVMTSYGIATFPTGPSVDLLPAAFAQDDGPLPPPPEIYPVPEQYPPPPEVYVDEAPQFIYSPPLNLYVAVGVPYDIVYAGSGYFYCYGGRWYRGRYYNGPWVLATRRYYPPALLRYRVDQIRYYRDVEYRRYERNRAHYDGQIHRPHYRGKRRS